MSEEKHNTGDSVELLNEKPAPRYESQGRLEAKSAVSAKKISLGELAKQSGITKAFWSQALNGKEAPTHRFMAECERLLGVPAAHWTIKPGAQHTQPKQKLVCIPETPTVGATPQLSEFDESAISLARGSLASVDAALAGDSGGATLTPADTARLLGLRNQVIKTIGALTGELDQTDLQKFRLSPEFRSTVRRLVGAVQGCPTCSTNVEAVLGSGDLSFSAAHIDCSVPLVPEELTTYCERVEKHVDVDDLAAATDVLHYRANQRERELAQLDLGLCKRVHAALKIAQPIIQSSKIGYAPADEHRQKVVDLLAVEIERGNRVAAFTADFGALATKRALEL